MMQPVAHTGLHSYVINVLMWYPEHSLKVPTNSARCYLVYPSSPIHLAPLPPSVILISSKSSRQSVSFPTAFFATRTPWRGSNAHARLTASARRGSVYHIQGPTIGFRVASKGVSGVVKQGFPPLKCFGGTTLQGLWGCWTANGRLSVSRVPLPNKVPYA